MLSLDRCWGARRPIKPGGRTRGASKSRSSGAALHQRQVGLLPGADAAVEPVHLLEAGLLQALGGVAPTPGRCGTPRPPAAAFALASSLFSGSNWLGCTVLAAGDMALLEVVAGRQVDDQRVLAVDQARSARPGAGPCSRGTGARPRCRSAPASGRRAPATGTCGARRRPAVLRKVTASRSRKRGGIVAQGRRRRKTMGGAGRDAEALLAFPEVRQARHQPPVSWPRPSASRSR